MTEDQFDDKLAKSFDFASELIRQEIAISSAILPILVAAAQLLFSDLSPLDVWLITLASISFLISIAFGCLSLMALTFALSSKQPSINRKGARSLPIIQSASFLIAFIFIVAFAVTGAIGNRNSEDDGVLTNEIEIMALFPTELQGNQYAQEFAFVLAEWNSGRLSLPEKHDLRVIFETRLNAAVSARELGYETPEWRDAKMQAFSELPEYVAPRKKLDTGALRSLIWAYSINLPLIEKRYEGERAFERDRLPLFLVLGEAQRRANESRTTRITSSYVANAAFQWWTNIWPFCAPRETSEKEGASFR